jgi:hypothetical protein
VSSFLFDIDETGILLQIPLANEARLIIEIKAVHFAYGLKGTRKTTRSQNSYASLG